MSASYVPPPPLTCVSTAEAMNPSRRCTMEDVMLFVPSSSTRSCSDSNHYSMKKNGKREGEVRFDDAGDGQHQHQQHHPSKDEGGDDDDGAAPAAPAADESARRDDGDGDDSAMLASTNNNSNMMKESSKWNYCAIYDGHGGRDVVDFLRHALHRHVVAEIDHLAEMEEHEARQEQLEDDVDVNAAVAPSVTRGRSPGGIGHSRSRVDVGLALERAFLITDIHAKSLGIMSSGATVAVALIKKLHDRVDIVAANAGDARIVLCTHQPVQHERGGAASAGARGSSVSLRPVAVRLTTDHNCGNAAEVQRIEQSGGFVFRNRVVGVLAITRSLGDHALKPYVLGHPYLCHATAQLFQQEQQHHSSSSISTGNKENQSQLMETPCRQRGDDTTTGKTMPAAQASSSSWSSDDATPDDTVPAMDNYPHFVIVACDGLWDVMSDQEAVELVLDKVQNHQKRQHVAQELVDEALRRGTTDNVSAMVVFL